MTDGEKLQKLCGCVEVADDLVHRSKVLYLHGGMPRDVATLELFEHATLAIALVAEALRGQIVTQALEGELATV